MTSEEMKNEVLSRAAALDKARSRRIKTAAATAVCAVIICAAVIPVFKTSKPSTASPSAQTAVRNAGTAPAGNTDETTVRVTISAPAGQTGQTTDSSSAPLGSPSSGTSPSDETQKIPNSVISDETTTGKKEHAARKNEPTTKKNEPTTKKNDSKPSEKPETTKKACEATAEPDRDNNSVSDSKPTVLHATEQATVRPAPTRPDSGTDSPADRGWIAENNNVGLSYESVENIVKNKWSFYIKSVEYNSDLKMFKFPSVTPVFGWIEIGGKSYSFYAESYSPIEYDGEYLGKVSDLRTSLPILNSYKVYRFSGIKGENRDMLLVTDSERYFVFAEAG